MEDYNIIAALFTLAFVIFYAAAMWVLFAKAGKPGWTSLVPILNTVVMLSIAGKPWWWMFLLLIPFVNIVVAFIVIHDLVDAFGKGMGFAIGMFFLPFIFLPILAFGDAQFQNTYVRKSKMEFV